MYSIIVNINGKPHQKRIPQAWEDVQWIDYINALQADGDLPSVLEALTGIPRRILEAMSATDFEFIETQCSFFWTEEVKMQSLPVDFVKVQIASDTWQKLIDCEQEFKRVSELQLPQIAAAQLIIKTYTKRYSKDGSILIHPGVEISSMRVPEALSYWDFFFGSSMSGQSDGLTFTTQKQMTTKLQQGLKRFKVSLGLQPLMRLRKETLQSMTKYSKLRRMSSTQSYFLIRRRTNIPRAYESITSSSTRIINHE